MMLLSNAILNAREELNNMMKFGQLKDQYGHIWDIRKIEFCEPFTIL